MLGAFRQIHTRQRFAHGFRAHFGDERFRAVSFLRFAIFIFVEQLILLQRPYCPDQSQDNLRNKSRAPNAAPSCPAPDRCAKACT